MILRPPQHAGRIRAVLAALVLLASASPAQGEAGEAPFPREEPLLYRPIHDAPLIDSGGTRRSLRELWGQRPLIVTLVFERCVSICPFYLRSLAAAVAEVGGAGENFDVVVISFDPADSPASMGRLAQRHGLAAEPGWIFAVTEPRQIGPLAESLGFWIESGAREGVFDHPAMLAAIDRGMVVRLLAGATVHRRRLQEVVWELNRVLVPTYPLPAENVWFRCFDYDPGKGGITLDWGMLLLLLPGLAMFLTTAAIFGSGRRHRAPTVR